MITFASTHHHLTQFYSAVVVNQLWGPVVNLVGDGGYAAWSIGDWFVMKYSNIAIYVLIAVVFVVGMFIDIPDRRRGSR